MGRVQSFILFFLGLLLGAFCYWLASLSFFSRVENSHENFRIIASKRTDNRLDNCSQIANITSKDNIDIYCSFDTQRKDRGVEYKDRSTITINRDSKSNKAVIYLKKKIKDSEDGENHITEAASAPCDCEIQTTVDLTDIKTLEDVQKALKTGISNALNEGDDRIDEVVDKAHDLHKKKKKLKKRIAKCEIGKESTVNSIKEIEAEEKIRCRTKQLADIKDSKKRTRFFHSDVKKDLWYLASKDKPLDKSFFLSDYMRDLNNPRLFDYDYFSVRSAIDTIHKYNDLRLFMHELGDYKLAALNNISMQLPFYFQTNDNLAGRQDRSLLETAWNKNFKERPFPAYYSLFSHPIKRRRSKVTNRREGLSPQQFRAIVNSPEFQKLYRQ